MVKDGISIIIDENQLELCRNINNGLSNLTGLEIEEAFYDKMVVRDVKYLRLNLVNCWKPKY